MAVRRRVTFLRAVRCTGGRAHPAGRLQGLQLIEIDLKHCQPNAARDPHRSPRRRFRFGGASSLRMSTIDLTLSDDDAPPAAPPVVSSDSTVNSSEGDDDRSCATKGPREESSSSSPSHEAPDSATARGPSPSPEILADTQENPVSRDPSPV